MHDRRTMIEDRVTRFIRDRLEPALYRATAPVTITVWRVDGEPVPFEHAVGQRFDAASVGQAWGRPWGTEWFHVTGDMPTDWFNQGTPELVVDLGWDPAKVDGQAEALVHQPDGTIVKALNPRNGHVAVTRERVDLYLEAAANPDVMGDGSFRPTPLGELATAGDEPIYRLARLELGLLDTEVWELLQDVRTLDGLMRALPAQGPRRAEILIALERMMDAVGAGPAGDVAARARDILAPVLARPAYASAHRVVAVGHAHLDSAWLWPVRETIRKAARTFANAVALMDADPTYVFACSSAQQLAWVQEHYPALFERIREKVASGQFVPVGGMWVESDTNLPGSEAMARQFVAGKRFFAEEFGVDPLEVWLPDSFGYSASLPGIARAAGFRWFLTQKISWNQVNRMPHHTFTWEGIDGSRIFTHFPPVDTYVSDLSGGELAHAESNFREHGAATTSLVPFGYGDGGGGPTREHLAAAVRAADLEGSPTVRIASPAEFFERAEAEYASPPVWSGELYLEMHRGTYTSQAATKRGNRRSEHLLREAELWAATASVVAGAPYPYDELERVWRLVLLLQFHDILPGSAIAWVYREAAKQYAEVEDVLERVIADALAVLTGPGDRAVVANAMPGPRDGVGALAVGTAAAIPITTVEAVSEGHRLSNEHVSVVVDDCGLVVSLQDAASGRESIAPGRAANLLQLHLDTPNAWDAWDVDAFYRNTVDDLVGSDAVEVVDDAVIVTRTFGTSSVRQTLTLDGRALRIETTVDWHERERMLKLAFPLDVHAERAASEIQFGHVHRPTHTNTSWDAARFETVAHRWMHVGEPGYGVAIANDSIYGHDVSRDERAGGGGITIVRQSLLRGSRFPDPEQDEGQHTFVTTVRPGASIPDAVEEGYRANLPARPVHGARDVPALVSSANPAVVIEAVKLAEDRSGDVVVRLYESTGARSKTTLAGHFAFARAIRVDLVEREVDGDPLELDLRPFEIATIRFIR